MRSALSAILLRSAWSLPLSNRKADLATPEIPVSKRTGKWLEQEQRGICFLQGTPAWTGKATGRQTHVGWIWSSSNNFTSKVGPVDRLAG